MYLNKFSVRVVGGREKSSGYVEMDHEQTYKLCLRNSRQFEQCDAKVEIDGKDVGTWRIYAGSSITLERPAHDDGKFTFYQVGTREAQKAQLDVESCDLGLVKVTFTPEKVRRVTRSLTSIGVTGTAERPSNTPRWGNTAGSPEFFGSMCMSEEFGDGPIVACASGSAGNAKSLAGGTGLSGQSYQQFGSAGMIDYDLTQRTTIHLRLMAKREDGPRPLTTRSNPVPPRHY